MQLPITIGLHRSRFLDGGLIGIAVLATGATLFFPRPAPIQLSLLGFTWAVAYWAWRRLAPTLAAIRLEPGGQVLVATTDHPDFRETSLLRRATVHPWLTVVRLEVEGGSRHILLVAAGTMAADDFRRLRVFLRWKGDFNVPGGDP